MRVCLMIEGQDDVGWGFRVALPRAAEGAGVASMRSRKPARSSVRRTRNSSARRMTLAARAPMIGTMLMSHHTHTALNHNREQDLRLATAHTHQPAAAGRSVAEEGPAVGRLRRRLAQMHLAPATPA